MRYIDNEKVKALTPTARKKTNVVSELLILLLCHVTGRTFSGRGIYRRFVVGDTKTLKKSNPDGKGVFKLGLAHSRADVK